MACATTFQQMSRHCGWLHNLSADVATLRLAQKPLSRCCDSAAGSKTLQQMLRHCSWLKNISADVATLRLVQKPFSRCCDTAACATTFQFIIRRRRKLRKATVTSVMYVCPSVRPHGTTLLQLEGSFSLYGRSCG